MSYEDDLRELSKRRKKMQAVKLDRKELAKPPKSVFAKKGSKNKRGKSNAENNHRKPRGWTARHKPFTNHLARVGMTDNELKEFYKTGKVPARLKKEAD